jgi:hypothetical protein
MADIYSRQKTAYAGSFASDVAGLTIAGTTTALGIVQNVQVSYSQQVARIYDVSNGGAGATAVPVFYVGGRTQGQASIARVLGPQSSAICAFYESMGNVCSPQDLSFTFAGGCDTNGRTTARIGNAVGSTTINRVKYSITGAVMVNLAVGVGAQDMIVNESVALMFANMTCDAA